MLTIDGRNDLPPPLKITSAFTPLSQTSDGIMTTSIPKTTSAPSMHERNGSQRHIWIITGPAGCGKSTVAAYLAKKLEVPFIEGDDYHSVANRQKMTQGIPLTDTDRWDWLITLRDAAVAALSTSPSQADVVVTCSALKRKYRDVIRVAAYNDHGVRVHFVYLHVSEEVLLTRVAARANHFMPASMVRSQILSLEIPDEKEEKDVITCDCSGNIADVMNDVLTKVVETLEAIKKKQLDDDNDW